LVDTVSIGNIPIAKVVFCSAPPPPAGELGNLDIFSAELDRHDWIKPENWKRLTTEQTWEVNPKWSPDGTKIAFCSNRGGNFEIYTMDPDDDMFPIWTSDGRIVYRSDITGYMIMDSDGHNQQLRVDDRLADINWFGPGVVSVEPMGKLKTMWGKLKEKDGQNIAYYDFTNEQIKVIDANGGQLRVLCEGVYPSWFDPAFVRKYAVSSSGKFTATWGWIKNIW